MTGDQHARRVFPLFVGSGRSGTTLVRAIFNSHPDLAVAMEANFLVPALKEAGHLERRGTLDVDGFLRLVIGSASFQKLALDETIVRDAVKGTPVATVPEAARTVFAAYARAHGKPLYGDKTPGYVKHIPQLARAFPEAKFVHIIRDGRDTAAAYLARDFGPQSVGEVAAYWQQNVDRGRAAGRAIGPERYTEVRYEDLLDDFEHEVGRLTSFLGLDASEELLRYWEGTDHVLASQPAADRHRSAALPPTKGLRDWRRDLTPQQIAVFQVLAGDTLAEVGYELDESATGARARLAARSEWLAWQRKRIASRWRRGRRRGGGAKDAADEADSRSP